jgi:hypothetical protein
VHQVGFTIQISVPTYCQPCIVLMYPTGSVHCMKCGRGRVTCIWCTVTTVTSDVAAALSSSQKHSLSHCSDFFTFCSVAALNMCLQQVIHLCCQYCCSCTLCVVWISERHYVISESGSTQDTTNFLFNLQPAQICSSRIYLNMCSVGTTYYSRYSCYTFWFQMSIFWHSIK